MVPIITFLKKLPQSLRTGLLGVILTALSFGGALAQTDTEFWFVVPDITIGHNHSTTPVGGVPASLKFSSSNFAATVTISMPAGDPAIFFDIIVELAPYDFQVVNLNCWIVDLCNPPVAGAVDVNQLENKALTPDGINNFGLHITSTAPITAYYEVNNRNNKDIWALKGRNGLGLEFFTPFQNQANNGSYTPQPISAIDIVATEDGTDVTFTLPPGRGASYGAGPQTNIPATPAGSTFTVTLDRGQTFSLFPLNRSTAAANRLAGTKIESTNPIAVTITDDSHLHTSGSCKDVSGDQLIPTKVWDKNTSTFIDLIGKEYIAIRTALNNQDNLFILPVEDNTNIRIYDPAGTEVANVTRNARVQYHRALPAGTAYYHIVADKPVYVMHIGGFGCEVGAAILPPIEKCTGVPRVSFARTSTEDFYVVIMVRKGAEDGFEFNGAIRDDIFDPLDFEGVDGTEWSVARFGPISQANAAVGTHFMRNTKDIFHLGIVNGGGSSGCFYGYFSDYNEFNPETLVIETGSEGGRICSGQTLSLYASGGTKYEWTPATYLDDPTSETPTAYNIESSINYTVKISGACNTSATRHVNLQVGGPVTASFDSDFYTACATPPPLGGTPGHTFNFTSTSTGDAKRWWSWQLGETGTPTTFKTGVDADPDDARTASLRLENNTDQILEYHIKLRTADSQEFCFQEVTKIIRVYPYISVNASHTIVGDPDCQPLEVNFTATPIGNFVGASYKWDFGDGNSAPTQNATNTYYNTASPYNSVSNTSEVTITDKWNVCSVTRPIVVDVPPYLEAGFTANPVSGCSPLNVANFSNTSKGADSYEWRLYKDGALEYTITTPPNLTNLTNTNTNNQPVIYRLELDAENTSGCLKTYSQEFTVYPNPDLTTFSVTPNAPICSPVEVTYLAEGIINTDTYTWFVDANSVVGSPAVVPASSTGTFDLTNNTAAAVTRQVMYVATNDWGCSNTWGPVDVVVEPFVEAKISLSPEEGCTPLAVAFTNNSSAGSSSFTWDVDGTIYNTEDISPPDFINSNTDGTVRTIPVTLTARNSAGCEHTTDVRNIIVFPRATASFDVDFFDGSGNHIASGDPLCAPVTGDFTGTYQNATIYTWNFGELGDRTVANPQDVVFPNTTTANKNYTVTLVANNTYDCPSNPVPDSYTVHPEVNANFDIETLASCVTTTNPFVLDVSAPSIANITYSWGYEFNAQTAGNVTDPTFTNIPDNKTGINQEYDITLTATGLGGCSDTKTETITIYPEVQAQWDFTAPTDYCAPVSAATFDNTSDLYDAANPVTNIQWQVFDGATLVTSSSAQSFTPTLPNTSHTAQKTYDVHLTATSADGCVGQIDDQITVNPNPLARFNASITDECTPLVLDVVNESVTTVGSTYTWDWDNESSVSSSGQDHTVTYNNSTETIDSKHISLNIENEYGCQSDYDYLFEVFPQVNANLSITRLAPNENCGDEEFTFTNTSTAGASIDYYEWSFGTDKWVTSSTADFNRSFTAHGTDPLDIPVSVRAYSSIGCTNVTPAEETIYIFPRVVAAQSFEIGDICDGDVDLTLTNASSNVGTTHPDAATDFIWTFTPNTAEGTLVISAGSPVDLTNIGNIDPVVYNVGFSAETVWDYNGINRTCRAEITGNSVTVYPELIPLYDIPDAVCSGLDGADLIFVKNANSSGGDVSDVSLQWDFSDGNTRTTTFDPSITKRFTNLSDEDFITSTKVFATQLATGCTASREVDVRVHPKVESIFTFELGDVCDYPLPVTFSNASKFSKAQVGVPTEFIWDYGYTRNGSPEAATRTPGQLLSHLYHFYNENPNQIAEYEVDLTITQYHEISDETCDHTTSRTIQVYPEMLPSFNLPTIEGCNPLTVSFSNTSSGVNLTRVDDTDWNGQFLWEMGDGTTSTSIEPATREYGHTNKTQSHQYDISFIATNPLGCVKTAVTSTPQVTVYPWVESSFAVDRIEGCTPLEVTLNNTSTSSAYTYDWGFTANGANVSASTSTSAQPGLITFTNPLGASDVLAVQNPQIDLTTSLNTSVYTVGGGCAKSSSQVVSVFPHVYPSFDADLEGCQPLDVDFVNTTNVFGGTGNGNYTWNLGTGIQSNNQNHSQEYQNPSLVADETYDGRLTAVSQHGCTDYVDFQVTVFPKPQSRMELTEYMECSPFNLEIINQSVGKGRGSTLEFTFNYGDGTDNLVTFNAGNVIHPFRNFNDDIEAYTMSLYVETEDGCNDISYQTVHVYPEVTSIFDTDDGLYEQCNPFEIDFVNTSRNAWSYIWDFDDGITSSTVAPRYRFVNSTTEDQTYNVSLTVMSEFDCEHTSDLDITVFAAPIADFAILPPHQVFSQDGSLSTFEFRNQSRPQGMPASWTHNWTFGDGNTSTSMDRSISHAYEHWGFRDDDFRYEVTLSIDNGKCSDVVSNKLTLLPPEPISMYRADNYRSCSPLVVKFFNDSQFFLSESQATAFEWRLNNAEEPFSTEFEPTLTLTEPGYYNIGLRVYGDGGEKNYYRTFRVFENPVANFEAMPERVLLPNAKVHFFNLSENANKYIWDFGDGTPKSNEKDPIHVYDELGEYRVSLLVKAEYEYENNEGKLKIEECIDYESRFPAVWVEGEGKIQFPNAFMPSKLGSNGGYYDDVDYKNEVFHPVADGVIEYRLMVFNRWGEQIFESKDIKIGWDGYYQGKLAAQDVYVWRAVGKFSNGELFDLRGNVTLLR